MRSVSAFDSDGVSEKGKNQIKIVLMGYLGRYSLLDELGFERNALFRHADSVYQIICHVLTSLLFQSALRMSFASTVKFHRRHEHEIRTKNSKTCAR
jgi:hypothetical protein